jgi:hypothetical protein
MRRWEHLLFSTTEWLAEVMAQVVAIVAGGGGIVCQDGLAELNQLSTAWGCCCIGGAELAPACSRCSLCKLGQQMQPLLTPCWCM